MSTNYKDKRAENRGKVLELCPNARDNSGIYLFWRKDENDIHHGYVGQATNSLLDRLASHLEGYNQYIDLSIRKWGLYHWLDNPHGYHIAVLEECPPDLCDEREKHYIKQYANKGLQLKNITAGSQGKGKGNFDVGKSTKGYRDGLKQGYKNAQREVAKLFEKNLTFAINGEPNKVKERFLEKFKNFINSIDNE
jgi:hypothetical protein